MTTLKINNLMNENQIHDLSQQELANIHGGGDIYIYTIGPDGSIIKMQLVTYSGDLDFKMYV